MKWVVSVSLGSASGNHSVVAEWLGEPVRIDRFGTEGNIQAAKKLIRSLDGRADAFGLGGINLHYYTGGRRYPIPQGISIMKEARYSPVVDGSGYKDTVERDIIPYLSREFGMIFCDQAALVVSVLDRFGLAEALADAGCRLIIGDALFGLGIPLPFFSLKTFDLVARVTLPVLRHVPIDWLYPLGESQKEIIPRFEKYYRQADILAGDFHFIRRHLPFALKGKTIITSTVTEEDVALLRQRGVKWLVTTTPDLAGRSFGANVMEAVLVALNGLPPEGCRQAHYRRLLQQMGFRPRVERLN